VVQDLSAAAVIHVIRKCYLVSILLTFCSCGHSSLLLCTLLHLALNWTNILASSVIYCSFNVQSTDYIMLNGKVIIQ